MKVCLIVPYFGCFNNYFRFWLNSCGLNPEYDWLVITDAEIPDIYPTNVHFVRSSLNAVKQLFEQKLSIKICLKEAYKLCDFKQFYGFLFSDYLQGYDYWGYCDCDTIWGHFSSFITEKTIRLYDKILRTGHLSFIRNRKEINENFFKYETYKISLTNPVIYGYDESIDGYHLGFAGELQESGFSFLDKGEWIADVDFRHFPFYTVGNNCNAPSIFVFDNGRVYQVWRELDSIVKREKMYLHLQKRKMKVIDGTDINKFIVCPNEIRPYNDWLLESKTFWDNISSERENYFDYQKEKKEELLRDIKRFICEPDKIACLKYRLIG